VNLFRTLVRAIAVTAVVFGIASFAHGQVQQKTQPATPQINTMPGITQTPWFSNMQVRQQLKLNDEQFNNLNKAYQQAYTTYQKDINGLDKTLPDAQRQQRMRDLEQNFYKDLGNSTNTIFTDPAQRQRYNQLYWQYQGYRAFSNPTIAEMLKLTPEQRDRFNQMQSDWTTQMGKLGPLYQTDKQAAIDQFGKLQAQNTERINSVLTPEQRTAWQQMAGMPFVFPPEMYFNLNTPVPPSK